MAGTQQPTHGHPGSGSARSATWGTGDEWVTIAQILGAFGVHGEMKIRLLTDIPDRFAQLETIYIHRRPFTMRSLRTTQRGILLHLMGIDDPETVGKFRGAVIEIPLAQIAPLPEGQYYIHDLIGLEVHTVHGQMLGRLRDVIATGSNDIYVVDRAGDGEVLVPAIKDVVKEINLSARTMLIDPIPGLLDPTE
jgi:16S rRNA processing protein RimM